MTQTRPAMLRQGHYSAEELANCAVVEAWFARMTEGRIDEAFALVDQAVVWALPRADNPDYAHGWQRLVELSQGVAAASAGRFPIYPIDMIAKDETVCVRARSDVRQASGKVYRNQYSIWFEVRGGRIAAAAEYIDTAHVNDVFGKSMPTSSRATHPDFQQGE